MFSEIPLTTGWEQAFLSKYRLGYHRKIYGYGLLVDGPIGAGFMPTWLFHWFAHPQYVAQRRMMSISDFIRSLQSVEAGPLCLYSYSLSVQRSTHLNIVILFNLPF